MSARRARMTGRYWRMANGDVYERQRERERERRRERREYIVAKGSAMFRVEIASRRKREAGHLPSVTDSNNFRRLSTRHQSSSSDTVRYGSV